MTDEYARLTALKVAVPVDHYYESLGKASSVLPVRSDMYGESKYRQAFWVRYVHSDPVALVVASFDKESLVQAVSISTVSRRFTPTVTYPWVPTRSPVTLGVTPISEAGDFTASAYGVWPNSTPYLLLSTGGGHAQNFRTWILGWTGSGCPGPNDAVTALLLGKSAGAMDASVSHLSNQDWDKADKRRLDAALQATAVTTTMVTAPNVTHASVGMPAWDPSVLTLALDFEISAICEP